MRRHLGSLLVLLGLALMVWPVVTWGYGAYWQDRLAKNWEEARQTASSGTPGAADSEADEAAVPEAFARMRIDRLGLDALVVEGDNEIALRRGPAHLPTTGSPGESRNCVIAAHRDAWFQRLDELQPGDTIQIERPGCAFQYVVREKQVVDPDRADLLETGSYPMLTLVTCTGPRRPRSLYRILVFCYLQAVHPS